MSSYSNFPFIAQLIPCQPPAARLLLLIPTPGIPFRRSLLNKGLYRLIVGAHYLDKIAAGRKSANIKGLIPGSCRFPEEPVPHRFPLYIEESYFQRAGYVAV